MEIDLHNKKLRYCRFKFMQGNVTLKWSASKNRYNLKKARSVILQ